MRSKEVEKAINDLMFIVVTDIYDNEVRIDKTKAINEYNQSLGIALDYISELEKENADAKEYADEVWRQNQELRIENETNYEKACDKFNEDLKKILAQDVEVDYVPKQVIRDKIKELEHEKSKRTQLGVFMLKNYENQRLLAQIEVLKSIIGE